MKLLRLTTLTAAFLALTTPTYGAAISITIDTGQKAIVDSNGVTALTGGSASINRDGAQAILGYYQDSTAANPFGATGQFIALTGPSSPFLQGGARPEFNFTIGDTVANGAGNGEMFILTPSLTFNTGIADSLFPAPGTPLVLRFYNRTTIAASTFLLDLSNSTFWTFKAPATPASTLNISLDDAGLVRRGSQTGISTANDRSIAPVTTTNIGTTTQVPEPASALFASIGAAMIILARRRRN